MAEETKKEDEGFTSGHQNVRYEKDKDGKEVEVTIGTDEEIRAERLRKYEKDLQSYNIRYRPLNPNIYKESNDINYKGGFYYDSQLEDPYLSISLHANTKIVDGKWVAWSEVGSCLEPIDGEKGSEWSKKYGIQPIARSILSEDFSYSIANNFSDYNGGNALESGFESLKPWAPILEKYSRGLGEATKDADNTGSWLVNNINSLAKKASKIMGMASGYLNKALFVQGTRFTYYNGTQFNFNNMEMKFIVFSDYVKGGNTTWVFQSVEDYIATLQPYVMGIYSPYNADFLANSGFQGEAKKFISEYIGFQDPPGGFSMDTKNLGNALKGTLRMNIGGTWAIDNLVLKNMNVNMSRVQAKHPEKPGETVPLYAEISLQLQPASSFIDTGYKKILEHGGLSNIRGNIASGYKDRLDELKKHLIR